MKKRSSFWEIADSKKITVSETENQNKYLMVNPKLSLAAQVVPHLPPNPE